MSEVPLYLGMNFQSRVTLHEVTLHEVVDFKMLCCRLGWRRRRNLGSSALLALWSPPSTLWLPLLALWLTLLTLCLTSLNEVLTHRYLAHKKIP